MRSSCGHNLPDRGGAPHGEAGQETTINITAAAKSLDPTPLDPASSDSAETRNLGLRLREGDPGALQDCYLIHGPSIGRYLARLVPLADVEDVRQRVFWEAWRARDRYDANRDFGAWLLGIARKRAIDHLRAARPTSVSLESLAELRESNGQDAAERVAHAQDLAVALDQLSSEQRQVLKLAYFDGYTQTEIAALLGTPLGTIKTRTARGLSRLGKLMTTDREGYGRRVACA